VARLLPVPEVAIPRGGTLHVPLLIRNDTENPEEVSLTAVLPRRISLTCCVIGWQIQSADHRIARPISPMHFFDITERKPGELLVQVQKYGPLFCLGSTAMIRGGRLRFCSSKMLGKLWLGALEPAFSRSHDVPGFLL
jgi:hypothetical protein